MLGTEAVPGQGSLLRPRADSRAEQTMGDRRLVGGGEGTPKNTWPSPPKQPWAKLRRAGQAAAAAPLATGAQPPPLAQAPLRQERPVAGLGAEGGRGRPALPGTLRPPRRLQQPGLAHLSATRSGAGLGGEWRGKQRKVPKSWQRLGSPPPRPLQPGALRDAAGGDRELEEGTRAPGSSA